MPRHGVIQPDRGTPISARGAEGGVAPFLPGAAAEKRPALGAAPGPGEDYSKIDVPIYLIAGSNPFIRHPAMPEPWVYDFSADIWARGWRDLRVFVAVREGAIVEAWGMADDRFDALHWEAAA